MNLQRISDCQDIFEEIFEDTSNEERFKNAGEIFEGCSVDDSYTIENRTYFSPDVTADELIKSWCKNGAFRNCANTNALATENLQLINHCETYFHQTWPDAGMELFDMCVLNMCRPGVSGDCSGE